MLLVLGIGGRWYCDCGDPAAGVSWNLVVLLAASGTRSAALFEASTEDRPPRCAGHWHCKRRRVYCLGGGLRCCQAVTAGSNDSTRARSH